MKMNTANREMVANVAAVALGTAAFILTMHPAVRLATVAAGIGATMYARKMRADQIRQGDWLKAVETCI